MFLTVLFQYKPRRVSLGHIESTAAQIEQDKMNVSASFLVLVCMACSSLTCAERTETPSVSTMRPRPLIRPLYPDPGPPPPRAARSVTEDEQQVDEQTMYDLGEDQRFKRSPNEESQIISEDFEQDTFVRSKRGTVPIYACNRKTKKCTRI